MATSLNSFGVVTCTASSGSAFQAETILKQTVLTKSYLNIKTPSCQE